MTGPRRPVPPDAERMLLVSEIRSLKPKIDAATKELNELYDERAIRIAQLDSEGLRYIDLQRVLGMNGGSITVALKRAARLRTEQATEQAPTL